MVGRRGWSQLSNPTSEKYCSQLHGWKLNISGAGRPLLPQLEAYIMKLCFVFSKLPHRSQSTAVWNRNDFMMTKMSICTKTYRSNIQWHYWLKVKNHVLHYTCILLSVCMYMYMHVSTIPKHLLTCLGYHLQAQSFHLLHVGRQLWICHLKSMCWNCVQTTSCTQTDLIGWSRVIVRLGFPGLLLGITFTNSIISWAAGRSTSGMWRGQVLWWRRHITSEGFVFLSHQIKHNSVTTIKDVLCKMIKLLTTMNKKYKKYIWYGHNQADVHL